MSVMQLLRQRSASNPVLTADHAAKLAMSTPVGKFNIHEDLDPLFAGTEARFMTDVYSRLGWHVDTAIANSLRAISTKLTLPELLEPMTLDLHESLRNQLETLWNEEVNNGENGFEAERGQLHMLLARITIRESWHNYASLAAMESNRIYTPTSIQSIISSPRRQEISSAYRGNALVDALTISNLLTNVQGRQAVSIGVNYLTELAAMVKNTGYSQEQLDVMEVKEPPEGAPAKVVQLYNHLKRRQEIMSAIGNFSAAVQTALAAYEHDLATHEETLDRFYKRDLSRIPVMMFIYDWVARKMLEPGLEQPEFHQLPEQIQIDACEQAKLALGQTLERFKDRPSYVYHGYKQVCTEAFKLLDRVIALRLGKLET